MGVFEAKEVKMSLKEGYIQLKGNKDDFTIVLTNYQFERRKYQGKGEEPVKVESGAYFRADIRLFREDGKGDVWSVRTIYPDSIAVRQGETTVISGIEGPKIAKVYVRHYGGNYFYFGLEITDTQGNIYSYFRKNKRVIDIPQFKVKGPDDEEIMAGYLYPG